MFLIDKREDRVKSRACADGGKHKEKTSKEYFASPTVMLERIIITSAIKDNKERDVSTVDIPVAYLHTKNYEYVITLLRGRLEELMAMLDPNHLQKYVTMKKNGQTLLYVKFLKPLYGILSSALLF